MKASLALACAFLFACHRGGKTDAAPPEDEKWIAPAVFERGEAKVVEARRQLIAAPIAAGGRIAFDDLRVSHVFSPVTGRVTRVIAQPGQQLSQGSPLVAIASPDVSSAVADEVKARADLVAGQHEFDRQQKLFAASAGPRRDLETAEDNYRKAKAEEQRALQRLRFLRAGKLDALTQEYTLVSPIDGRVISRSVNPGLEVQGQFSGGTPSGELFTVGDTDQVWLFADLAENDLPEVRPAAAVKVRVLAYPDRVFGGRVDWISPTLDPALRTARVRCSLPNLEGLLKPEMFASVLIDRPALLTVAVPPDAVERINGHDFVYVESGAAPDGKSIFKRRRVTTPSYAAWRERRARPASEVFVPVHPSEPDVVAVWAGLSEGEKVLVDSGHPRSHAPEEVILTDSQFAAGKVATVAAEEREVAERFIAACSGGNLEELLAVLDPDVAGHAELGFAPHVDVEGRDNVAPRVLALFGPQTSSTLVSIPVNGEPGILALRNGRPFALIVLRTRNGLVEHLSSIADPRQLAYLSPLA